VCVCFIRVDGWVKVNPNSPTQVKKKQTGSVLEHDLVPLPPWLTQFGPKLMDVHV